METTPRRINHYASPPRMVLGNLYRAGLNLKKPYNDGIGPAKAFGCGLLLVRRA